MTEQQPAAAIDTTRRLVGDRAIQAVVNAAVAHGDAIETHALEIKSDVDPTSKPGIAKVARFVLGAANRFPTDAADKFEGYAYLMLGVGKDSAPGISMFDTKALEDRLRKYLDPDTPPRWDVQWLPTTAGYGVCVISVAPPADGDPVQICHGEFQADKPGGGSILEDGRIYYREKASTRVARSGEVKALIRRAREATPPVDISVELTGGDPRAYRDDEIESTFDRLFDNQEEHLRKRFRGTDEEIAYRLAELREAARTEWGDSLEKIAAYTWPGAQFTIANSAGTYLEEIELVMEFPEGVVGIEKEYEQPTLTDLLPAIFPAPTPDFNTMLINSASRPSFAVPPYNSHLDWENSEDGSRLTVIVSDVDLRPDTPWSSDPDELVLFVFDDDVTSFEVKWRLTAKRHHRSYNGAFTLHVEDASSLRDLIEATKPTEPDRDSS